MGTRKAAKGDGHMKRNKKNEVFFLPLLGLLWILLLPGLGNEQGENGQIPSGGVGQQPDEEQGQQEVGSMPQAILSVDGQEFTIGLGKTTKRLGHWWSGFLCRWKWRICTGNRK